MVKFWKYTYLWGYALKLFPAQQCVSCRCKNKTFLDGVIDLQLEKKLIRKLGEVENLQQKKQGLFSWQVTDIIHYYLLILALLESTDITWSLCFIHSDNLHHFETQLTYN